MKSAWMAMSAISIAEPATPAKSQSMSASSRLVRAWITVAENKTIEPIRPIAAMGIGPMLDHCDA